jgi:hypothetical protein
VGELERVKLHDLSTEGAGNAYPLPPGWSHGEDVTVIGFDHGYVRVLGDGRETTVFIVNIDSGWDEQYAPGGLIPPMPQDKQSRKPSANRANRADLHRSALFIPARPAASPS